MAIKVFLSSTSQDLQDVRDAVKDVIISRTAAEMMETWETEYRDDVEVCRQKVETSYAYLGLFAYRRGWEPPLLGGKKSITEAEFDWAIGYQKPLAVLIPQPGTDFDKELKRRAKGQTQDESKRQQDFLNRVRQGGTCMPFRTQIELGGKIASVVSRWTDGSVREIAREATAKPVETNQNHFPLGKHDFVKLGREQQVRRFKDSLNEIINLNLPDLACFLIHGPAGCGHRQMAELLRLNIETNPRHYQVAVTPSWREKSLAALLEVLGDEIEKEWKPGSIEVLAKRLMEILEVDDVIIEIANVQRFDGSLTTLVENFWKPLVAAFKDAPSRRLIVLAGFEKKLSDEQMPLLYDPEDETQNFSTPLLIKLPELTPFSEVELRTWLRNVARLPKEKANAWAATLIEETGGNPQLLYSKLENETDWMN
jgi:hypothetical protein